jgi:magnesium transporter
VTEILYGLHGAERERVAALREQGQYFWLDVSLHETSRDDLVDALGIPERALGALGGFGDPSASRALHADGESVAFAVLCYVESEAPAVDVAYGLRPVEIHGVITADYLLTLHEERFSLPAVLALEVPEERSNGYVVYSILEAMLETTSVALGEVERRLEGVGMSWTEGGGTHISRATLREDGPRLGTMRRWVSGEQGVFARIGVEIGALRGFDAHDQAYFDRLYEQLTRLLGAIDAAGNAMAMLLNLQLNERAYVVSVLATIFVPLTFITGFFGMNFGWMVGEIDTALAFWLLGLIIPIATALLGWRFVVRRFLAGDDGT